ncbi:hypothetical protein [Hymenobacter guriensis]|uniref:LemA family protein n=1 Tax=Hymenobacter guriensis TaxID=2793065 RepID=A0ABS0KVT5_9BACT|nr:hypothetical protein [Hymenobacter guriensis]MBG8551943.1 hypothetical protein [Hymenobacter guriensis]
MKLILKPSLWLACILLFTAACNRTPKPLDPASAKAVKVQLDVLQDTVASCWTEMIASDDAKLSATSQVLRALAEQPGTDRVKVQQLTQANNRLKALRYDQQSMRESARIDAYDAAQDSLLRALYPVALPEAGQPNELVRNLTEGIQQTDNEVVGFRVRYDRAAKHFNDYLQLHQPELQELGGKYAKLQPLPLFTIQL